MRAMARNPILLRSLLRQLADLEATTKGVVVEVKAGVDESPARGDVRVPEFDPDVVNAHLRALVEDGLVDDYGTEGFVRGIHFGRVTPRGRGWLIA
jgi:hypothetical protein